MNHRWRLSIFVLLGLSLSASSGAGQPVTAADPQELGLGLYCETLPSDAETIAFVDKCKANGFQTLFPSLSGGSTVYWKTDRETHAPTFQKGLDAGYDALASLIKHAHAAGMKVYPSVAVGPAGKILESHPEWETLDREGRLSSETTTRSFSLAYPEARAAKIAVIMDLVNGYEVDGIMLDYCRYPETTKHKHTAYGFYGYDAPLVDACRSIHGFDPRREPIDSPRWNLFNAMRRDSVTSFVREFRAAIDQCGKKVRVGGFGDVDPTYETRMCGRDCPGWAREKLIDDYFLATYNQTVDEMAKAVRNARELSGENVRLLSALSPFNRFLTTNDEMIAAGEAQLSGGADGLWVYRSDFLEEMNLWAGAAAAARLQPR